MESLANVTDLKKVSPFKTPFPLQIKSVVSHPTYILYPQKVKENNGKVFIFGVFLARISLHLHWTWTVNLCIPSKCGKIRTILSREIEILFMLVDWAKLSVTLFWNNFFFRSFILCFKYLVKTCENIIMVLLKCSCTKFRKIHKEASVINLFLMKLQVYSLQLY